MASSVFFKFKSQREPTRVEFDGTGISVFELKREIIIKSGLGDGTDFDLAIYTDDGKDEYDDDTTIIPRSTTVVARRLPAMKPGAGRAARYVSGKMPVTAKNASRREQQAKASAKTTSNAIAQMNSAMTEEEKMAAMFQAQSEQWSAQQEEMAHQQPVFKPGARKPVNVPDHEPPQGYVCYRCGEKGHWIQVCPTNDNPEFDNRPRLKRTTGIPRSRLKKVDEATALEAMGEGGENSAFQIMRDADGDYVIAVPDQASWEQFQAKAKSGAATDNKPSEEDKELEERGLFCSIDKKMFIEPMKTPCCGKTYCNDCITNALIESDFICPACSTEGVLIDDLKPDEEANDKIKEYLQEKDSKVKERSKSPAAAQSAAAVPAAAPAGESKPAQSKSTESSTVKREPGSQSPPPSVPSKSIKSPPTEPSKPSTGTPTASAVAPAGAQQQQQANPKKRPAEDAAENPKIPKGPKAMQQQQQPELQDPQQAMMQQMMNAMPGMPGMGNMGMMGFPNMAGMPMDPSMMNGFPAMGNMGNMGNMGMMNPMMMGNMPNFGMDMTGNGGFQGMNGWGGMGNNNNMNGGGMNMGMNGQNAVNMNGGGGNFNYQKQAGGGPFRQFGNQPADDGEAYFRKPVNPQRHQNRARRMRPSDYREL